MDTYTCEFEDCKEPQRIIITDVPEAETHFYCERHFVLACIAYLFAAALHDMPNSERLLAMHDGLYIAPEEWERG